MARLLPPERDIGVLQAPVRSCLALTGVFLIVLLSVALLERIGIDPGAALTAIVGAAFALFALAALLSHSRRAADFYVADRKISGPFGGLASAGTFAGLLVIGLIGGVYGSHAEFLLGAAAFALGYLILGTLIAPGLRSFGAYTAGDFIGTRFGGPWVRLMWAAIAFSVSFVLLLAQLKIAAPLIAMLLRITPEYALYLAAGVTLIATVPGGMRSLTWTQAIQYFVIVLACVVPVGFLAVREPTAESALTQDFGALLVTNLPPLASLTTAQSILPQLLAAIGVASLPHLMARTLTAQSRLEASASMVWGVLFAILLVVSGLVLAELLMAMGMPLAPAGGGIPQLAAILVSLPATLAGLVLAGVLAALFSLGQATLFAAAAALSHDVSDEVIDKRGPEGRRIFVARIILVGVAAGAVVLAPIWQADAASLIQWALAFAAAGAFAPVVLGLWWTRTNEIGALGGMAAGFGFTAFVFLMAEKILPTAMTSSDWANVGAPTAAAVGLAASAIITIGLSLVTPALEGDPARVAGDESRPPIHERPA
jgi:cation/acetate symporter